MVNGYEGFYCTVEGLDGAGTTTIAEKLCVHLDDPLPTREPYDEIWTGRAVREALSRDTAPMTDVFLFMADRAEHLDGFVKPALEDGRTVVSDRGADSTYAYQPERIENVISRDAFEWLDALYAPWDVRPDVTVYLDVSVDTALERCDGEEKYEKREFLERARKRYERQARRHPDRFVRVDAEQDIVSVLRDSLVAVEDHADRDFGAASVPAADD